MKTLAKVVMLLVVLGFCLPSYGDILVYKLSLGGTYFELQDGEWEVSNRTYKGYVVLDFNYGTHTIDHAESFTYWKDQRGKQFERSTLNLELVRVDYGTKIQWIIMQKDVDVVGEQVAGGKFLMLTGSVRERNIGVEVNRKVAATLSGYNLEGTYGEDIVMLKIALSFYPAWTYRANGDEGNRDFDTAVQMIEDYLTAKGYTLQAG
jgi:hypothetical protein